MRTTIIEETVWPTLEERERARCEAHITQIQRDINDHVRKIKLVNNMHKHYQRQYLPRLKSMHRTLQEQLKYWQTKLDALPRK